MRKFIKPTFILLIILTVFVFTKTNLLQGTLYKVQTFFAGNKKIVNQAEAACTAPAADVMLVADYSPSTYPDYPEIKDAMKKFIDVIQFINGTNGGTSRIGFIGFTAPNLKENYLFPLTNNFNTGAGTLKSFIDTSQPKTRGSGNFSCLQCGEDLAAQQLLLASRPNVPMSIVFLSDGAANERNRKNGKYDSSYVCNTGSDADAAICAAKWWYQGSPYATGYGLRIKTYTIYSLQMPYLKEDVMKAIANAGGPSGVTRYYKGVNLGDLAQIYNDVAKPIVGGSGCNISPTPTLGPTVTPTPNPTLTPTPTITPTPVPSTYSINGDVFIDQNKNKVKDAGEANYTGRSIIRYSGGPGGSVSGAVQTDTGVYSIKNLLGGTYTISYAPIATGYSIVWPLNGPPPSFTVSVGSCSVPPPNDSTGGVCFGQSIVNLRFPIIGSPWIQAFDFDVRFDNGITDKIPVSPVFSFTKYLSAITAGGSTPGIVFPGDGSTDFGNGQASSTNWVAGGTIYPEVFTAPSTGIQTSYSYLLNSASNTSTPITDLATVCASGAISNCTLPANLPQGVYQANGDLALNAYSFPSNNDYVFLINGNLTLKPSGLATSIQVPTGSTALFSASGDIIVDKNIRATNNTQFLASPGQLQGMYIAGGKFTIQGNNDCSVGKDIMLNVDGNIVVNANGGDGNVNKLINNRDLCEDNATTPSLTVVPRLDFILNSPPIIMRQNNILREVAP